MNIPETQSAVRCKDGLGDFAKLLQSRNAKLRAGCKMTVNTTTLKTAVLPTIEMQLKPRKWLPLKMPDGRWYFKNDTERDETLKVLMSPNVAPSHAATTKKEQHE